MIYFGLEEASRLAKINSEAHRGMTFHHPNKGKSYEEIHGEEKALEIKEKASSKLRGKQSLIKGLTFVEYVGVEKAKLYSEKKSKSSKGKPKGPQSEEHRKNNSKSKLKYWNTSEPQGNRNSDFKSLPYDTWVKSCLIRDEYTCQRCGKVGGQLHIHHIKPWPQNSELRYEVSNGKTVCAYPCHGLEHEELGRKVGFLSKNNIKLIKGEIHK